MRIAIIVPDRGDRPDFIKNCKRMIDYQTIQPEQVLIADWKPKSDKCDITERYRIAYHYFDGMNMDLMLFMENDDWYKNDYIETIVSAWVKNGKPEIFGTNYTYYYHIGILKYEKLVHLKRASMMNTLIKPDLTIKWPKDEEPYTDMHLWQQLKGITFTPEKIISIGIKHNVGKSGGHYHGTKLEKYKTDDSDLKFLSENLDTESLIFYKKQHEKIQSNFR